jgi:hypothetical protein
MSPLPSATSPTRASPRRPSLYGRSHATPGSPYRLTRHPSVWQSRDDKTKRWSAQRALLTRAGISTAQLFLRRKIVEFVGHGDFGLASGNKNGGAYERVTGPLAEAVR